MPVSLMWIVNRDRRTSGARKRGGSLGRRRDQGGREKDQGEPAQPDFDRSRRIVPSDGPLFPENYHDREVFLVGCQSYIYEVVEADGGGKGSDPGMFRSKQRE